MSARRGRPKNESPALARKNVTLDAETLGLLQQAQEQMATELGFRPTLAQAVQRLIVSYSRRVGQAIDETGGAR